MSNEFNFLIVEVITYRWIECLCFFNWFLIFVILFDWCWIWWWNWSAWLLIPVFFHIWTNWMIVSNMFCKIILPIELYFLCSWIWKNERFKPVDLFPHFIFYSLQPNIILDLCGINEVIIEIVAKYNLLVEKLWRK